MHFFLSKHYKNNTFRGEYGGDVSGGWPRPITPTHDAPSNEPCRTLDLRKAFNLSLLNVPHFLR